MQDHYELRSPERSKSNEYNCTAINNTLKLKTNKLVVNNSKSRNVFKNCGFYTTILWAVLSCTGALTLVYCNWFDSALQKLITLSNGTYIYRLWSNETVGTNLNIYLFNYTNTDAVLSGKEKPIVKEIGPYVFRHLIGKANININTTDRVSYSEKFTNIYMDEYSNGSLDDIVILPNYFLITFLNTIKDYNMLTQLSFSSMVTTLGIKPFMKVPVRLILYGFDDRITLLRKLITAYDQNIPTSTGIIIYRDGVLPDQITIGTGIPDLEKRGLILKYNGRETAHDWYGDQCNNITASDGSMFPPEAVAKSETLYVYRRLVCRRLPLVFLKNDVTRQGYPMKLYSLPSNVYSYDDSNEDNQCFCEKECPPSGIHSIAPCYYNMPLFISNPHFLYGDKSLTQDIVGLNPDPEKHNATVYIHESGIFLGGDVKLQVGITLNKARYVSHYSKMKDGIALPIVWVKMDIQTLDGKFNTLIYHFVLTVPLIKKFMLISFIILFIVSLIRLCYYLSRLPLMYTIMHRRYLSSNLVQTT